MSKVILLDLENNMPTAQLLRDLLEHVPTLYLFHADNRFDYALQDLTEFSTWLQSGQVVILEMIRHERMEFSYAMLVGQLSVLLEPETSIDLISVQPQVKLLLELLQSAYIPATMIHIRAKQERKIPTLATIQAQPALQMVKKYCDALAQMSGKPSTLDSLKNSIANILQLMPEHSHRIVGMLINLKIVKRYENQISFRKKVLKKWIELNLNAPAEPALEQVEDVVEQLHLPAKTVDSALFKNFAKIDPVQVQILLKLQGLKSQRPTDIYALRDFLAQEFPHSDIRLLLKELLEKGYIYWNGHEVKYSHEMQLN